MTSKLKQIRLAASALTLALIMAPVMELLVTATGLAADRIPAAAGTGTGTPPIYRSKSLDFDNDVIEGMNKSPLDALNQLGKKDDKQQGHLYRRKSHFRREIRQSVQEMGYTQ